jgi:hypothetical protein
MKSIDPRKALVLAGLLIVTLAGCAVQPGRWNYPHGYNAGYGSSYPNLNSSEGSYPYNSSYESSYPSNDVGYDRAYASAGSYKELVLLTTAAPGTTIAFSQ